LTEDINQKSLSTQYKNYPTSSGPTVGMGAVGNRQKKIPSLPLPGIKARDRSAPSPASRYYLLWLKCLANLDFHLPNLKSLIETQSVVPTQYRFLLQNVVKSSYSLIK